jgi:uncharacterized protein YybS (DUF2232 family)
MNHPTWDDEVNWVDAGEESPTASLARPTPLQPPQQRHSLPLVMVETAFLASAASLIWLINYYFPLGPVLRIFFPIPMALLYLRRGQRAAWMGTLVSGLLLSVLMGPTRSILYVMPYAFMGVQLGVMWRRGSNWYFSIAIGTILGTIGFKASAFINSERISATSFAIVVPYTMANPPTNQGCEN